MRAPAAPPILLMMTYPDGQSEVSPFLVETLNRWPTGSEVREIAVGPLPPEDAKRLALARLGATDRATQAIANAIARGSGGGAALPHGLPGPAPPGPPPPPRRPPP